MQVLSPALFSLTSSYSYTPSAKLHFLCGSGDGDDYEDESNDDDDDDDDRRVTFFFSLSSRVVRKEGIINLEFLFSPQV